MISTNRSDSKNFLTIANNIRKREASPETDTAKRRKFHSYTVESKLEAINHVKMGIWCSTKEDKGMV